MHTADSPSHPSTSRAVTRRQRRLPGSALALFLLAAAALLPACSEEEEPETRCGGGAPQCCCDTQLEVDRYQLTCRAACEDNPERPEGVCVSETACGGA